MAEVISLEERRNQRGGDDLASDRLRTQRLRWSQAWSEAWELAGRPGARRIPIDRRLALSIAMKDLVEQVYARDGKRSGKLQEALAKAAENLASPEYRGKRGCPEKLLRPAREAEYRLDRFVSDNPKALRSKLVDWLAVIEAIAELLGRSPEREVVRFLEAAREGSTMKAGAPASSALAEAYDTAFDQLSGDLNRLCARVARTHDAATYYEFADRSHAAWHERDFISDDGWCQRFKRREFATGLWVELEDGSYVDGDPSRRSPLGPIAELLIHAPLARVHLGLAEIEFHPELLGDFEPAIPSEWLSLELDVHLVLRPDVDDPAQAGGLLIHPSVAIFPAHDYKSAPAPGDWWADLGQITVQNLGEAALKTLRLTAAEPVDHHEERALRLALERQGQARIIPIDRDSCQAWLAFGASSGAPGFGQLFAARGEVDGKWAAVGLPGGMLAGCIQENLLIADGATNIAARLDHVLAADAIRKTSAAKQAFDVDLTAYETNRKASSALAADVKVEE